MPSERPFVPMQVQEQARPVSLAQTPVHVTSPSIANQDNSKNAEGEIKLTKVGTCMECGADHWMKDCPRRQVVATHPGEKNVKVGLCMECGENHWMKDCPHRKQPAKIETRVTNETFLPIVRHCQDCLVTHFSKDCPSKRIENNVSGKTTLTYVEVIPSPQTSETKIESANILLRVVTRVQTRNNEKGTEETGVIPRENEAVPKEKAVPKRRRRRPWIRKSQIKKSTESTKPSVESNAEKLRPKVMGQPTPNKDDDKPILKVSSGGSILVEKVIEHLDAI